MNYNEILNSDISKSKNVIYKFTNLINQKIYIGQTRKQFRERLAHHIWQMNNNPSYFHKALSKYGLSNFDITILETCENPEDLNGLEIYWIDYYQSSDRNKGYNLTLGGSGVSHDKYIRNYIEKDETRLKRSESAKRKWQDPEYRKRYKKSRKEYIKIVKLSLNGDLIEIYPTFSDAESSMFGKRNGSLWYPLRRYKEESIELNGFIWMTLESYNKLGKQKVSEQTKR